MFVKASWMFICLVAMAGTGCGQQPGNSSKKANNGHARGKGNSMNTLLWKISGNGLQKPSYVFGTMHILCEDDAALSANLKSAIKESDKIYFEIDLDNMAEVLGTMKFLRMNDGKKLSELLSADEYGRVEAYFKKNPSPLPFSMMGRFKPYFISSMIGEQMMTCEKKNGMEEQIMKESKQYNKEIKGLETIEFQASIFDSIPYEKQAHDLVQYIDSLDNYKNVMVEMVDVYRRQDLLRMDTLMHKSDPGMEEYMDLLLYNRNRHWVEQMPGIMNGQTILFAVGAGHLAGDQGVLNLLRKKGYTVSPVAN